MEEGMDDSVSARSPAAGGGAGVAAGGAGVAAGGAGGAAGGAGLHARSFKLRFAPQREPGRSYVSAVKPPGLPATVAGKFYARDEPGAADDEAARRALRRIRDMFRRGPTDKYDAPLTSSQVVGWHAAAAAGPRCAGREGPRCAGREGPRDPRLQHHIRDSAWLKARLRVLAADDKLKQPK